MRYKKIISIMTLAILLLLMMSTSIQAIRIEKINNFSAAMNGSKMKLTWSSATGVSGYYVYVNGTRIGSVNTNEASLIGFSENTTYRLKITGYTTSNVEVAISDEISFTTAHLKTLEQVKNLTVVQMNGYVTLNWSGVNNANKYQVFVDVPNFGNINIGEVTTTNAVLKGFKDGQRYGFSVRACHTVDSDNANYGEKSEAQYIVVDYNKDDTNHDNNNPTKPDKVNGVKVYNVEETTATVSWEEVKNIDGYEVRISKNYGQYEVISDTSKREVYLSNLDADNYYRVKVVAYKWQNGNKIYGNESDYYSFTTKQEKIVVGDINDIKVYSVKEKEATVSWSSANNAEGYEVLLSKNSGEYKVVYDTSNREVYLGNLDSSSYYRVKVIAYKWVNGKKQYGAESPYAEFNTKDEKVVIDRVSKVYVEDITKDSADISWSKVDNADGYEVLLARRNEEFITVEDTSKRGFYLEDLEPSTRYKVKVVAYKWVNGRKQYGEESSYKSFTTKAKTIIIGNVDTIYLDKVTKNRAEISWSKGENATGYYIYLAQGSGNFQYKGATKNRSYTFTNLKPNTYYQVMVEAYRIVDGEEHVAVDATTKTFTTPKETIVVKPATVTGIKTQVKNRNEAYLTWNKVIGATGYEVWISKAGGSYQRYSWTTDNQEVLKDLSYSTNYRVQIRAYKNYSENGNTKTSYGNYSNIVSFKTQSKLADSKPVKVTGVKVTVNGSNATLTWKAVSGATGYEVYYSVPNIGYRRANTSTTYKVLSGVATSRVNYCTVRVRAYRTVNGEREYGPYSDSIRFKKD